MILKIKGDVKVAQSKEGLNTDFKCVGSAELWSFFNNNKNLIFQFFEELRITFSLKDQGSEEKAVFGGTLSMSDVVASFDKAVNKLGLKWEAKILVSKYGNDAFEKALLEVSEELDYELANNAIPGFEEYKQSLIKQAENEWYSLLTRSTVFQFKLFEKMRSLLNSKADYSRLIATLRNLGMAAHSAFFLENDLKVDGTLPLSEAISAFFLAIDVKDPDELSMFAEFNRMPNKYPPEILWQAYVNALNRIINELSNTPVK